MKKLSKAALVTAGIILSGCVSTQTISGIDALGYERFGNFRGAEAYACPKPKCASDNVIVVHKTEPLTAKGRADLAKIDDPAEAASVRRTLNGLAGSRGNSDVRFGNPKRTTISDKPAYIISFSSTRREPSGAIIIIEDGNKVQYFAGLSNRQSDGRQGAITLARQWAR